MRPVLGVGHRLESGESVGSGRAVHSRVQRCLDRDHTLQSVIVLPDGGTPREQCPDAPRPGVGHRLESEGSVGSGRAVHSRVQRCLDRDHTLQSVIAPSGIA